MASYISETMLCHNPECGQISDDILDRALRDEFHVCKHCGEKQAKRTFSVPNVSTSKTSQSIPDVAAKGRFDHIRRSQMLKKERAKARARGDWTTEKKVIKEQKDKRK
jgi:hypothetical protein